MHGTKFNSGIDDALIQSLAGVLIAVIAWYKVQNLPRNFVKSVAGVLFSERTRLSIFSRRQRADFTLSQVPPWSIVMLQG